VSEQNPTPAGEPSQQQPYAQAPVQPYEQPYGQYAQPGYAQGGYAQPGYAQPYPYYAPVARPTNTLAVVALIAAICGLSALPFVGSVAAVIMAPMARKQIRETGENGDGMAVAGMIVGWVGVGLGVIFGLLFLIPFLFLIPAATMSGY